MRLKKTALVAVVTTFLSLPAIAQQHPAPTANQEEVVEPEIVVTGFAKPYKLTGKQLVRAQTAFNAKRGQLAPQSQLYFQIISQEGGDISDLDLYLKRGDEVLSLPIDGQSRFVLPPLNGNDWTLFANRNRKAITITPTILSPGTSERNRMLGDLRLQCETYWAMSSPETSIVVRAMFSAAGGCKGTKFGYYVSTQAVITSGIVSDGSASTPLRLWGDHRYQAPIGIKAMPNTARVTLSPP